MKILYICRLYSGFEQGLKEKKWVPRGAPTIAKMIEFLDQSPDFDLCVALACKDYNSSWRARRDITFKPQPLKTEFHVLAGRAFFPDYLPRMIKDKLSDLRQLINVYRLYKKFKPDLIYCDRVNLLPAAAFSRLTRTPVIWRVMGILPEMSEDLKKKSFRSLLKKFLYRSPFAAVICTLDGSGGGPWMNQALDFQTKKHLLINGVDFDLKAEAIKLPENKIKVLFAGRIEDIKGAREFMYAMLEVIKNNKNFHALYAGDGLLKSELEAKIADVQMQDHFTFLGTLSAEQLKYVRQNSDMYISLNKQGNLSNVNLEALADGVFSIFPKPPLGSPIDHDTDSLIPHDIIVRTDLDHLAQTILKFSDSLMRKEYQEKISSLAKKILPSWDTRIQQEIEIYKGMQK